MPRLSGVLGALALAAVVPIGSDAISNAQAGTAAPTGRFIVKLRPEASATGDRRAALAAEATNTGRRAIARTAALSARLALPDTANRALGDDLVNIIAPEGLSAAEQAAWLERLAADPDVEFVEVDQRRFVRAVAGDTLFGDQWYLQSVETAAARFDEAWDLTTGLDDTVIAVLDTGIRFEHPDLGRVGEGGRLLPGYDFVGCDRGRGNCSDDGNVYRTANDGDAWDPDPSDPGDWLTRAELNLSVFSGCTIPPDKDLDPSSWHGTRVAGMLGAVTNNGTGMAAAAWNGRVLPVRVLGKCGGYDSDIIVGMRWAAGLPVPGVPANPFPAKVINMSLGGPGTCTQAYGNAVSAVTAAGAIVVAAAGNVVGGSVEVPGRCPGVIAVSGLRHVGTKVGYSSTGPEVAIAAPAGNCINDVPPGPCLRSLPTTTNLGQTTPGASGYLDQFSPEPNLGTSFAAPIVSAVLGLMHAVNANLTPAEFRARLQASAVPFPPDDPTIPTCPALAPVTGQCNCTATTCGAGIASAIAAVNEALRPIARVSAPADATAGTLVTLDGTTSAPARERTIASYSWAVLAGPAGLNLDGSDTPTATVLAPGDGPVTVRLTVTDDAGRSDSATVTIGSSATADPDPVPGGGGGGGGGALDLLLLLTLAVVTGRTRSGQR